MPSEMAPRSLHWQGVATSADQRCRGTRASYARPPLDSLSSRGRSSTALSVRVPEAVVWVFRARPRQVFGTRVRHHLMQPARAMFERQAMPIPNQTMQRTASKLATDVLRVCHPPFGCMARFVGLAVADLVSRFFGRGGVSREPASYRADGVDATGLGQRARPRVPPTSEVLS
jgi:hypothetical protein